MKKTITVILSISILLYFAIIIISNKTTNNSKSVAKVGSVRIYESDIKEKFLQLFNNSLDNKSFDIKKLPPEAVKSLSKEVYLEKKLIEMAKKSGIHKNPEIKDKILKSKNAIILENYLEYMLTSNTTEEKINNKYLQITSDLKGKKEYNVSKIILKDRKLAQTIFKKLNKASPKFIDYRFISLYNRYSVKTDAGSKGEFIIETLIDSDMLSQFDKGRRIIIKEMDNGETHIYKINSSRAVIIPDLDDQYKIKVKNMIIQEVMQKFIEKSLKGKEIVILDYK